MDDKRNGFDKDAGGRLISAALEEELAGFEERGLRTCRTRIPGKSSLPKVLLTSNPLIERDLQKTLKHIHKGRNRRQKTWELNQKQFFVSQIFDPDYNLRFTQRSNTYSNGFHTRDGPSRLTSIYEKSWDASDDNASNQGKVIGRMTGLGVFMPPLHPSQRFIEKQKIPNTMQTYKPQRALISAISTPNLADKNRLGARKNSDSSDDDHYDQRRILRERHMSQGDLQRRENTTVGIALSSGSKARVTLSSAKYSTKRDLQKSVSLPEISVSGFVVDNLGEDNKVNYSSSRKGRKSCPEVLCEDKVIAELTRSLPLSIMIKANQNINRVVQQRKAKMIETCKNQRDKNSFEDPRWKDLHKVLVSSEQT